MGISFEGGSGSDISGNRSSTRCGWRPPKSIRRVLVVLELLRAGKDSGCSRGRGGSTRA
jgi:hypothetical protein